MNNIIVAGSSALGQALARRLIERDESLTLTYHKRGDSLDWAKAKAHVVRMDVRSQPSVAKTIDRVGAQGGIGVLVYCAGIVHPGAVEDMLPAHWGDTFAVNVHGAFYAINAAMPYMLEGSKIVLASSTSGGRACPNWPAYAASKAALTNLGMSAADALFSRGIRVYILELGRMRSKLRADLAPEENAKAEAAAGRLLDPDEAARFIETLCFSENDYVSGMPIRVHAHNRLS